MPYPKFRYWRSKRYLRWIASLPCLACGIEGYSQAAHSNQAKHGKGRGIKASDQYTFPLCSNRPGHMGCHATHDLFLVGAERDATEDRYIAEAQRRAPVEFVGWQ